MTARRSLDAGRVSALASRPGIDTRCWLSLATVTELGFNAVEGLFADVQLQPTGEYETAYFGTGYAGGGFGDHNPIQIDDLVLIAFPGGDPGQGPVIISRWNNAGDPPHADFSDGSAPSQNRVIRVRPGQQLILRTTDGDIIIEGEEGANVGVLASGTGEVHIEAAGGAAQLHAKDLVSIVSTSDDAEVTGNTVQLGNVPGSPAQDAVVLELLNQAQLARISADFTALKIAITAGFTAVTPLGGGPAALAAFSGGSTAVPSTPGSTAASKVRAT
jgi:hypothetical protein